MALISSITTSSFHAADVQSQFRDRDLLVRHAQLPPEAHEISTLLRLVIIRKAAGDHRLDAPPLLGVAESVRKVRQSHGQKVPTALTSTPGEVIPSGFRLIEP